MAATPELPEGTDTVIAPLATASADTGAAASGIYDKVSALKDQATDKARDLAAQGKERAVGALDNVSRLVEEAAGTIDEKVGQQYGDYARRAAGAVEGLASTLRSKEIEQLLEEAREAVKKSPAIAIGAAAALGFVVARLIKAGASSGTAPADDADTKPPRTGKAPGAKDTAA